MSEIKRYYLVIGWGYSKKDKTPYSRCAEIKGDRDGNKVQFVDINSCIYIDCIKSLGEVVETTVTID